MLGPFSIPIERDIHQPKGLPVSQGDPWRQRRLVRLGGFGVSWGS
jgi:hypothetical protein